MAPDFKPAAIESLVKSTSDTRDELFAKIRARGISELKNSPLTVP